MQRHAPHTFQQIQKSLQLYPTQSAVSFYDHLGNLSLKPLWYSSACFPNRLMTTIYPKQTVLVPHYLSTTWRWWGLIKNEIQGFNQAWNQVVIWRKLTADTTNSSLWATSWLEPFVIIPCRKPWIPVTKMLDEDSSLRVLWYLQQSLVTGKLERSLPMSLVVLVSSSGNPSLLLSEP